MSRSDRHIDNADFILDLTDHDARFARVRCHPVEHAGRRTHRVGTVELHARCRPAHGHSDIAAEDCVTILCLGNRIRKRHEVGGRIIVAGPRNANVLGYYGFAFFLELLAKHFLQRRKTDTHHMQAAPAVSNCRCRSMVSWFSGMRRSMRSPILVTFSLPVRIVSKVWPPRMIDW